MADAIKRGATFRKGMQFDEVEWAKIYPYTAATALLRDKSGTSYSLTVAADVATRTLVLTAPTTNWAFGTAFYDLLVVKSGVRIPVPFGRNVSVAVLEGVTP